MARTDLESAGGQNKISLEFCARPSRGLPGYLPGVGRSDATWLEAVERVRAASRSEPADTWLGVIEHIESLSRRAGARDDVIDKIRSAARREAFFVVTGQQPGAFGGPLLTLYKAVTAVAVASALERITSLSFVPLYWCGADDTDFQEVRGLSLVTKNSIPISTAMAQQAHGAGVPIGDIALEWLEQVWKNVRGFASEFEHGSLVAGLVDGAFGRARDHGEHAAAMLGGLTGGSLAVIDGRSAAIRRHAHHVILEYVRDEEEVKREIVDGGRRLERAGYHAQLTVSGDSGVFLLENGARKNVSADMRPLLLDAAQNDVGRCSPGAAARNLVQDAGLKPVAVVLGPAEIAYRAQLSALYDRFDIAMPLPIPRLTGTFLAPALAEIVEGGDGRAIQEMLRDPRQFVRSIFEGAVPPSLREAARDLERRVGEAADAYSRAVDAAAPSRSASRVRARIADLKSRSAMASASASEVGKDVALERWPFLSDLASLIRPVGKPQERSLSALVPYLFGGAAAGHDMLDLAATYVDDLLDGRTSHIVYSCTT